MKRLPIVERHGWWLMETDRGVSEFLARGEPYEPHIARRCDELQMEGTFALDIGANCGAHTVAFAERVGDEGQVFAFEPQRLVYYQLCANVITRGLPNVVCVNAAVGEREDYMTVEVRDFTSPEPVNIGDTHVWPSEVGARGDLVQVVTLDKYLGLRTKRVSAVKLDIQGTELPALRGMVNILREDRPEIFIEIEEPHLRRHGFSTSEVIQWLNDQGYDVKLDHDYDYVASPR